VLPFGRLWYAEISHAIGYAEFYSRSHNAVIRVYNAGAVIETHALVRGQRLVSPPGAVVRPGNQNDSGAIWGLGAGGSVKRRTTQNPM